jgi:hypothetical protein
MAPRGRLIDLEDRPPLLQSLLGKRKVLTGEITLTHSHRAHNVPALPLPD